MVVLVFHAYFVLEELELGGVESVVAEHVSEDANGLASIAFEDLEAILGVFSVRLG